MIRHVVVNDCGNTNGYPGRRNTVSRVSNTLPSKPLCPWSDVSMACYVHDLMLHPQPSVSMVCCIHHLMCPQPNVFMTQCIHSLLSPHILSQIHCMPTCMHCIGCVCWGKGGGGHTWPRWLGLVCMVGKELKFESWKVKINTQNAFQYHSHCFQKKKKNLYAENQL